MASTRVFLNPPIRFKRCNLTYCVRRRSRQIVLSPHGDHDEGITNERSNANVKDFVPNGPYIGTICVLPPVAEHSGNSGVQQKDETSWLFF